MNHEQDLTDPVYAALLQLEAKVERIAAQLVTVDPNSVLVLTVPERHRMFVLNQLLPELTRLLGPDRYLVIVGDDINMTVQTGRPTNPEISTDQPDHT